MSAWFRSLWRAEKKLLTLAAVLVVVALLLHMYSLWLRAQA